MITILISIMLFSSLAAPPANTLMVFRSEGVNKYEPLIKAVVIVESNNGKYLYNAKERAVGWFQIRQVRVDDYNRRTGLKHALNDFYDYDLSRKMFLYYASGKNFEQAAKSWNGSGSMTKAYWKRVKKHLN